MLQLQLNLLGLWWHAGDVVRQRLRETADDDRGEINASVAMIVILVIAAITAGGIIAGKLIDNANNVPSP